MRRARTVLFVMTGVLAFAGGTRPLALRVAHADEDPLDTTPTTPTPAPGGKGLALTATPLLGAEASIIDGWVGIVVRVDNDRAEPLEAVVRAWSPSPWASGAKGAVSEAPVHVAPKSQTLVPLATRVRAAFASTLQVELAKGDDVLVAASVTGVGSPGPLLVDVSTPSRLAAGMRGWPMLVSSWGAPLRGGSASTALAVSSPTFDAKTGDPILPERAAEWAGATAVLVPSDVLARLPERSQRALARYVLAGGTLAVAPRRPEDLRTGIVPTLAGGPVTAVPPPKQLVEAPAAERPTGPLPDPPDPTEEEGPPAVPLAYHDAEARPVAHPGALGGPKGPTTPITGRLSGYHGGNLHPSELGASAAYGLGEVHVLGFDPTERGAAEDAWVHGRILALVERAWDRRSVSVFPHGSADSDPSSRGEVRKVLDPNEGFRPALAIATVLLVLYAVVAGPLLFLRASRRSQPLAPLVTVPIASLVAFAAIVAVGLAAKGFRGRARRLALVEAAAGLEVGTVRRFRGLFTSESESLSVPASSKDAVLAILPTEGRSLASEGVLTQSEAGLTLQKIPGLPWQTVVVEEDDFVALGRGVAIGEQDDATVVANGTGRVLRDVVVYLPKEGFRYFETLAPGERRVAADGVLVAPLSARTRSAVGTLVVHPLPEDLFDRLPGEAARERLKATWAPFFGRATEHADWFPDDVPVLLAETDDPDMPKDDSGLRLERSRVLVRVVGKGGSP